MAIPSTISANGTYTLTTSSGSGSPSTTTFASACTAVWSGQGLAGNGTPGTSTHGGHGGGGGAFAQSLPYTVSAGEVFYYGYQCNDTTDYNNGNLQDSANSAFAASATNWASGGADIEAGPGLSNASYGSASGNNAAIANNGGEGGTSTANAPGSGGGGNATANGPGNNGSNSTSGSPGAGGTDGSGNPGGGSGGASGSVGSNGTNGGGGGGGKGAGLPAGGTGTAGFIQVVVTGMAATVTDDGSAFFAMVA